MTNKDCKMHTTIDRMRRLWLWFRNLFVWTQCEAEFRWKRSGSVSCCIRRKGHFGPHTTSNGSDFYTPPDYGY